MTAAAVDFDRIVREEQPQAQRLAVYIRDTWAPGRVIDVGAGPGIYVAALRDVGIRGADGVDNDPRSPEALVMYRHDITREARVPSADFVLCLEVLEHIERDGQTVADALRYLVDTGAKRILFSAAQPGQGGEGHVNCQLRSYWARLFASLRCYLDIDETEAFRAWLRTGPHMGWLYNNAMVFRRV